jgi:arylsulfatase A-like enzyme
LISRGLALMLAAWALALAGCSRVQARPRANGDSVVMIVIDTLRRDHLAIYGYERDTAPFLDELARQGAAFDGFSPASWTKPATVSLLTGLHPLRHQAVDRVDALPAEAVTLAERLRRVGYTTLGASANGWVSPAFGLDRGFGAFLYRDSVKAGELNRELDARLDRLRPPFFLYVHYIDPHLPYDPVAGWDGAPLPPGSRPVTVEETDAPHFVARSPELLARTRDLYDGEIRGVDDALRELVAALSRRGLMKSTLLVVTADHGEELGEHGRMSHGQSVYQEVLRIPLVLWAPHRLPPHRLPPGRRPGRASLLDVVPTVLDLLGLEPSESSFDGRSLAALLTGPAPEPESDRPFLAHLDFIDGTGLALTQGKWSLVLGKNPYRKEIFDLDADPGEHRNLLGSPEAAAAFSALGAQMADLVNGYSRAALKPSAVRLDPRLSSELAALGYAGGSAAERRPRVIPRRISPPGPAPGGRLGWEAPGALGSCVQLTQPDAGRYLLAGWYDAETGGRWSERRGSLVLATPEDGASRLLLQGASFRPAPVRLRVLVEHRLVLETEVPVGSFSIPVDLRGARLGRDSTLIELETATAFVPAEHGAADSRSLGLFLASACFEPSGGGF